MASYKEVDFSLEPRDDYEYASYSIYGNLDSGAVLYFRPNIRKIVFKPIIQEDGSLKLLTHKGLLHPKEICYQLESLVSSLSYRIQFDGKNVEVAYKLKSCRDDEWFDICVPIVNGLTFEMNEEALLRNYIEHTELDEGEYYLVRRLNDRLLLKSSSGIARSIEIRNLQRYKIDIDFDRSYENYMKVVRRG